MKHLTVGSFNIQHGRDHLKYRESGKETIDLPLMASLIREEGIDICTLNEVRNQEMVEGMVNQATVIGDVLGYQSYFARAIDLKVGEYGNAIVSRYPIRAVRTYPVGIPKEERVGNQYYEDRVVLAADIDVNGTPLTVMTLHFGLADLEQTLAIEVIRHAIEEAPYPVVLMGDFNFPPSHPNYRALCSLLTDAAESTPGDHFTYPSHAPMRKIDYIFYGNGVRALSFRAPNRILSDHLAVAAEIEVG